MTRIAEYTGWTWLDPRRLGDGYDKIIATAPQTIILDYWTNAKTGQRVQDTVIFACPCGCDSAVILPCAPMGVEVDETPFWNVGIDGDKITITPSVHRLSGCCSHYWLEDNKIRWA